MDLHDTERPQIGGRPAWLSKKSVIPPLELWVKENGALEIRMFLPVTGGSHLRYHTEVKPQEVAGILAEFSFDPEATVLELFENYKELKPDVKTSVRREPGVLLPERKTRARLGE